MTGTGKREHSHETAIQVRRRETALIRSLEAVDADDEIRFEDEGWDSRVYLVNGGEAVFKFPRSAEIQVGYAREIAVLRMVESRDLAVRTPKVRWVGPGHSYFGYLGIPGRTLENVGLLPPEERGQIGRMLGRAARELHTLEIPGMRVMSIDDEIAYFQQKYLLAAPVVGQHFSARQRLALDEFYSEFMPAEMTRLGGEPRLCHGDLGPWDVVVGTDASVGIIIDFGDVCQCDRSKDLIGLFDPVMLDAALGAYGDSERLREKIAVRAKALPAMDLVFFDGKRDAHGLILCVGRIRSAFAFE